MKREIYVWLIFRCLISLYLSLSLPTPSTRRVGRRRRRRGEKQTSSFRVEKTSPGLQELLDGVHKQIRNEERENMIAQADFDGESMSEVTKKTLTVFQAGSSMSPRMPIASSARVSHIWDHTDHSEHQKRVVQLVLFLVKA